jgi:hypothetical protein
MAEKDHSNEYDRRAREGAHRLLKRPKPRSESCGSGGSPCFGGF